MVRVVSLLAGVVVLAGAVPAQASSVSIVSGNIVGRTQTLPLMVEERFRNFDAVGAYSAGFALALMSLLIVAAMTLLSRRREHP